MPNKVVDIKTRDTAQGKGVGAAALPATGEILIGIEKNSIQLFGKQENLKWFRSHIETLAYIAEIHDLEFTNYFLEQAADSIFTNISEKKRD